jgi:hypothetical protein
VLEPDLRRAEDVSRGDERERDAADDARLAEVEQFDRRLVAQPRAQHTCALARREVVAAPPPGVVAVRVRDHRAIDGQPGIDVQVGGRTIQAAVGDAEHVAIGRRAGNGRRPGEQKA